jgi:hypothetical protein
MTVMIPPLAGLVQHKDKRYGALESLQGEVEVVFPLPPSRQLERSARPPSSAFRKRSPASTSILGREEHVRPTVALVRRVIGVTHTDNRRGSSQNDEGQLTTPQAADLK